MVDQMTKRTIPAQGNIFHTLHLESTKQREVACICQMQYYTAFQNETTMKENDSSSPPKQSSVSGLNLLQTAR